jgi:thiamine pyrophosphate-dependent acetolactate synthase large subunit-like protein
VLIGEGGLDYHLGDLETALGLGLKTTTVVMNDAAFSFCYDV